MNEFSTDDLFFMLSAVKDELIRRWKQTAPPLLPRMVERMGSVVDGMKDVINSPHVPALEQVKLERRRRFSRDRIVGCDPVTGEVKARFNNAYHASEVMRLPYHILCRCARGEYTRNPLYEGEFKGDILGGLRWRRV